METPPVQLLLATGTSPQQIQQLLLDQSGSLLSQSQCGGGNGIGGANGGGPGGSLSATHQTLSALLNETETEGPLGPAAGAEQSVMYSSQANTDERLLTPCWPAGELLTNGCATSVEELYRSRSNTWPVPPPNMTPTSRPMLQELTETDECGATDSTAEMPATYLTPVALTSGTIPVLYAPNGRSHASPEQQLVLLGNGNGSSGERSHAHSFSAYTQSQSNLVAFQQQSQQQQQQQLSAQSTPQHMSVSPTQQRFLQQQQQQQQQPQQYLLASPNSLSQPLRETRALSLSAANVAGAPGATRASPTSAGSGKRACCALWCTRIVVFTCATNSRSTLFSDCTVQYMRAIVVYSPRHATPR